MMTPPRRGLQHDSWPSNTVLITIVFMAVLTLTVITDIIGEPPNYLVGLLGAATSAWFGTVATDKAKRDAETSATAKRAEVKADVLTDVANREHPGSKDRLKKEVDRRTQKGDSR